MQTIEKAVGNGRPVLIENIGETVDVALHSLLERNIVRRKSIANGSSTSIHIDGRVLDYDERFRLYLTTVVVNPNFIPEIVSKVTLLNFAMNEQGLQRQMLATIIAEERVDLQDKKEKLIVETAKNRDLLYKLESNIFDVLSASEGNILEDENAINILTTSKTMSEEIQMKQTSNAASEAEIDAERHRYLPLAEYSTILYFCLTRLVTVNSMYQFSLQWFQRHFVGHMRGTRVSTEVDGRIANLKKSFTQHLYHVAYPALLTQDRLVFSFMICTSVLKAQQRIDDDEIRFLFSHANDECGETDAVPDSITWLDPKSWKLLNAAAKLPKYPIIFIRTQSHIIQTLEFQVAEHLR